MDKKRGEVGSQVSSWFPSTNKSTPNGFTSSILPYGLQLRQTISSGTSVTIPSGINFVYAILAGAGGGNFGSSGGGGAGGITWGWTFADTSCVIGAGVINAPGGYTRYGHLLAGGGGMGVATTGATSLQVATCGGGGGGTNQTGGAAGAGAINFWGMGNGVTVSTAFQIGRAHV